MIEADEQSGDRVARRARRAAAADACVVVAVVVAVASGLANCAASNGRKRPYYSRLATGIEGPAWGPRSLRGR